MAKMKLIDELLGRLVTATPSILRHKLAVFLSDNAKHPLKMDNNTTGVVVIYSGRTDPGIATAYITTNLSQTSNRCGGCIS